MLKKNGLKNKTRPWAPGKSLWDWAKGSTHLFHHLLIIATSVSLVLSLPLWTSFIARKLLIYWTYIGNEKIFLASVEIVLAIFLILLSNYIGRNWKNKKLAAMAQTAGLVLVTPARGILARRRIRKLKEKQGFARDVMFLGATGFKTFVDPQGELAQVVRHSREAKIMLLNPESTRTGTKSPSIPEMSNEVIAEQIYKTIEFLRELKAANKNVRLKLYHQPPFIKLTILGDYLWFQHYHPDLEVGSMPKYVFKQGRHPGGLYLPFYQYFLDRWNGIDIPEYDLDTDELIYRDERGNERLREKLSPKEGLPGPERMKAPSSRSDLTLAPTLLQTPEIHENRNNDQDEDLITEEVFLDLVNHTYSRRN